MNSAHDCPIVAILIEIADMTMLTPGRSVLECPCCVSELIPSDANMARYPAKLNRFPHLV